MKRLLVCLALVLTTGALVFPSGASATHDLLDFDSAVDAMLAVDPTLDPPPNGGKHDFVVGGAQTLIRGTLIGENVGVSAHSGPLGEDAFGHVSATIPNPFGPGTTFQNRFRVTCVAVAGKVAALTGITTNAASNRFEPGTPFMLVARDSGLPGGAGDGVEILVGGGVDQPCPAYLPSAAAAPLIVNGNILIHDALP